MEKVASEISRGSSRRRVVITGTGVVSTLGLSGEEVVDSLRQMKSGVSFVQERKDRGFRSALSGVISGFDGQKRLDRKYRKTLPEYGWWAWDAICQSFAEAGIDAESLAEDERTGIIFGNDSSVVTGVEQCDLLGAEGETRGIGSGHIFRLLTSTITLNVCTRLQLHGVSWTVSGACASGAMAIGQAAELIAQGRQDRMICGGAQEISWQSMCSFDGIKAFSLREDAPAEASRPFDQDRDGLIPSGGAAAVFLEAEEVARARGANIIAEVCGYGTASDGYHISAPSGDGLRRAMEGAIGDAGLLPNQIDLVMAHATSTPVGDVKEAQALCQLFDVGENNKGPMVAVIKALTGHEFWMAGASQVVYALLMSRAGFVAGHPNLKKPAPEAAMLRIPTESVPFKPRYILCNAAGFGGTNGCLVVKVKS